MSKDVANYTTKVLGKIPEFASTRIFETQYCVRSRHMYITVEGPFSFACYFYLCQEFFIYRANHGTEVTLWAERRAGRNDWWKKSGKKVTKRKLAESWRDVDREVEGNRQKTSG